MAFAHGVRSYKSYQQHSAKFRIFEGLQYNVDDLGVDINVGLQSNDNLIEDINENDNLEEEYEINKEI